MDNFSCRLFMEQKSRVPVAFSPTSGRLLWPSDAVGERSAALLICPSCLRPVVKCPATTAGGGFVHRVSDTPASVFDVIQGAAAVGGGQSETHRIAKVAAAQLLRLRRPGAISAVGCRCWECGIELSAAAGDACVSLPVGGCSGGHVEVECPIAAAGITVTVDVAVLDGGEDKAPTFAVQVKRTHFTTVEQLVALCQVSFSVWGVFPPHH